MIDAWKSYYLYSVRFPKFVQADAPGMLDVIETELWQDSSMPNKMVLKV